MYITTQRKNVTSGLICAKHCMHVKKQKLNTPFLKCLEHKLIADNHFTKMAFCCFLLRSPSFSLATSAP